MCHCRTCRGECVQTLRTCQRHMNELNGPSMEVEEDSTESESEVMISVFISVPGQFMKLSAKSLSNGRYPFFGPFSTYKNITMGSFWNGFK